MTDHQQAAIEAVDDALRADQWDGDPEDLPGSMANEAEIAVEAAEPHLRRKWAEEVRALSIGDPGNIEDCLRHEPEVCDLCRGREQAAKLLEGAEE